MNYVELAWNFLNTPVGYMVSGFIILFVLNKVFDSRPGWAKYEGFMITAIKAAEKFIPNDTENKSLQKADKAIEYFIKSYEKAKGKAPSKKLLDQVKMGLPIVHHKIEDKPKV